MKRILVIGLDGASPHLVRRWRESLPHLSRLIDDGTSGTLWSTIPPRSIPAWYCFATGLNPAKLGVFGFSQRRAGTYDYTFANWSFCRAVPFWNQLNRHGRPVGVVHMPGTFPPSPVEGFLLSGWPGPLNRGDLVYTHPPELSREIDRILGRPFELVSPRQIEPDNDEEMLAERLRILEMHGGVAAHLLAHRAWRVALVVLSPLDRASHQLWRHMDPSHPRHDPDKAQKLGSALREVYQAHDAQVGRLLDETDGDDWVFIVSDHGFGPAHRSFYLNEWLRREGYLVLKDGYQPGKIGWGTKFFGRLAAPLFRRNLASRRFRRLVDPFKKRALSNFVRRAYLRAGNQGRVRVHHLPVDWRRTRAYSPDEGCLYLNLRGRDPEGIVAPGAEAERLLAEIISGLKALPDSATGRPVTVRVDRKEAIYHGPYLADAPDLLIAMDDYRTDVMAELGSGALFDAEPLRSGTHTREGLLIARGPGIRAGARLDAGLMDIAPTLLHLAGAPVPSEVDGRVLLDLFEEDAAPWRRKISWDRAGKAGGEHEEFTEEEREEIERQLRGLGYLG